MSGKKDAVTEQDAKLRANEKKWTRELMAPGWTMIPSVLMEYQRELGLNAVQFNILIQLAKHWWTETPPYVSKRTMARAMRLSPRTIQRQISSLERAGLIERQVRHRQDGSRTANAYAFNGLIEKARPYAAKMAGDRSERIAARARRKSPKLKIVHG